MKSKIFFLVLSLTLAICIYSRESVKANPSVPAPTARLRADKRRGEILRYSA